MNKSLKKTIQIIFRIFIVTIIVYVAAKLGTIAFDFGYRVFTEPAVAEAPGDDVLVQVKEGMEAGELAEVLEEKGLVRDSNLFLLQYRLSAYWKRIEPGIYTLNTSMTAKEMMVYMVETKEAEKAAAETETSMSEEESEVQEGTETGTETGTGTGTGTPEE